MEDKLGYSPLAQLEESAYITPINETYNSYNCLITGFQSSDLMKESEGFDFEAYEETLPELYKAIKQVDEEDRVWYPGVVKDDEKGVVFINGTSKEDWQWCGIKNIPVPEEEKERFKNPKTGEYLTHKSDPSSMKLFGKDGYIDSLDYLGFL
jgi:hypothetical protein